MNNIIAINLNKINLILTTHLSDKKCITGNQENRSDKIFESEAHLMLFEVQLLAHDSFQNQLYVISILLVHRFCLFALHLLEVFFKQNIHILCLKIRRKHYHTSPSIVNQPLKFAEFNV
jgi:hypothetical protein